MKLNKLITILLLIFVVLSVFLYLENDKNKVSASKTIKIYQETNKKQEKEITELKLQIVKESKDHSNQISNEKIKNDSLLKEQTTKYDELLKHSLNQEQEVFLLEQKIKEIENKYSKMVCYELKPKRQVENQQKYGQSMPKKVKKQ